MDLNRGRYELIDIALVLGIASIGAGCILLLAGV